MTLAERENDLIERYSLIEDRHERLNAITGHRLTSRELSLAERHDQLLVQGCASPVWLRVTLQSGKLDARFASDSVLVKGLVALIVELYHDTTPEDLRHFTPCLLEALGLHKMLSATRLNGLAQVTRTFHRAAHVD